MTTYLFLCCQYYVFTWLSFYYVWLYVFMCVYIYTHILYIHWVTLYVSVLDNASGPVKLRGYSKPYASIEHWHRVHSQMWQSMLPADGNAAAKCAHPIPLEQWLVSRLPTSPRSSRTPDSSSIILRLAAHSYIWQISVVVAPSPWPLDSND